MSRTIAGLSMFLLLAAGACTQVTLVSPQRQTIASAYSVEPTVAWNKVSIIGQKIPGVEVWTRDGMALQEVNFFATADGQALFKANATEKDKEMPVFRKTMTVLDIKELLEASLAKLEYVDFAITNLDTVKFGSANGFRFDIAFSGKSGLRRRGLAAGAVVDNRLLMIMFDAAALHYYERDRGEAERIVKSVELIKS